MRDLTNWTSFLDHRGGVGGGNSVKTALEGCWATYVEGSLWFIPSY